MDTKRQGRGPFVFGMDIGTRSVVGTVGHMGRDAETGRFVVEAMVVKEHQTRAMMDGQIHDISKVAETVRAIKDELERETGHKLTEVCIAAAGRVLRTIQCRVDHAFPSETVVTQEHVYSLDMYGVERAYEQMREETKDDVSQYYHVGYSVVKYYLNDYEMLNLEGHKARKVSVELIATFLPDEVVDGLYAAVEEAGLTVANLTLEPIAAINLAIPEHYRMLNLALVDVGAGTSDVSIAKEGAVTAFGMMPFAGDEITEAIAKNYLTDFHVAEKIKKGVFTKKTVSFKDIMGVAHKVTAEEVLAGVEETVRAITRDLAAKIQELNGGKGVSAVFVVGGGAKLKGFVEELAESLGLPQERVAIRGKEVLKGVDFPSNAIKKDSTLVTPIGICLSYFEQKNHFIYVVINGERVKLYDNGNLTVMDAVVQRGVPNEDLFPKRGQAIHFTVNGKKRMLRGEQGEAAVIVRNGKPAGLTTPIEANDSIVVNESTAGSVAKKEIRSLAEYKDEIIFNVNGNKVVCPKFAMVNGKLVSGYYEIGDGDDVMFANYYTVEQLLEFMDMADVAEVFVNNELADGKVKVFENFSVKFKTSGGDVDTGSYGDVDTDPYDDAYDNPYADFHAKSHTEDVGAGQVGEGEEDGGNEDKGAEGSGGVEGNGVERTAPRPKDANTSSTVVTVRVNGTEVALRGKPSYILVDVLDFYPFDVSHATTRSLVLQVNGVVAAFTTPLAEGDEVKIHWEG